MAMPQPPHTDTPDPAGKLQPAHVPGSDTPMLRTYRQLIGGIWSDAAGGEWLESLNPANGAAWALIPRGRAIDAERAVAAARAAFESATWRAMTASARGELLRRVATYLESHIEELAVIEARDNGKRLVDVLPQLRTLPKYFHYYAGLADKIEGAVIPNDVPGVFNYTRHEPLGVVVAITPWNSPLMLAVWKLAPALAAGNTVVLKPSEHASASTLELAAMLEAAGLPPGVVNVVTGLGAEIGAPLVEHPDVAKITFTGSDASGKRIAATAAADLKRVTLELGGKTPAILCDDFPLRKAAERLMFVKCLNAGQICLTVDHLFLPAGKTAEFVALAKEIVLQRYPSLDSPDLSAIIDARSFTRLTDALQQARAQGAQLVQLIPGQPWDAASRKIAPHLVINAPPDSVFHTREIFGPILPILEYGSLQEVVAQINRGPRPLAIYPFSNDEKTIQMLLERVMSGGVSVNDALFHVGQTDLPLGGVGESGMGHYHGREGFNTFSKLRPVFYQARFSALKFLWPPYGKFATKYLGFLTR